jgi:hypothetical protein
MGYSGINSLRKNKTSRFGALDLSGSENYQHILKKVKAAQKQRDSLRNELRCSSMVRQRENSNDSELRG